MAQLARIGAVMEWKWCLREESKKKSKKENRDNKEESKDGPGEDQKEIEKRNLLSTFCQYIFFVFCFILKFNLFFVVSNCMSKKIKS